MDVGFVIVVPIGIIRMLLRPVLGAIFDATGKASGTALGVVVNKTVGPGGVCPNCGFDVGAMATSCARCGYNPGIARATIARPVPAPPQSRPGQDARIGSGVPMGQCPNCEEVIPMTSRACPLCRFQPDAGGWIAG